MRQRRWPVLLMLAVIACDNPAEPALGENGELQVRPALVRALPGDMIVLDAVAFDESGVQRSTGPVSWSSLDVDVATVSPAGRVHATAPGWARIVAESVNGPQSDTAHVAVSVRLTDVSVGSFNACALDETGAAWCWGSGGYGVLGRGAEPSSFTPGQVTGGLTFDKVAMGYGIACGVTDDGSIYCWGDTSPGMCDVYQDEVGCHTPTRVSMPGSWSDIAAGAWQACASGPSGTICWGPTLSSALQPHASLTGPVAVGLRRACALDGQGRAFCWDLSTDTLVPVETDARFTDISAGHTFMCGLTGSGDVVCWGQYGYDTGTAPGFIPVAVNGDVQFVAIDAGASHVCGLTGQGRIHCWGSGVWTGALGEPALPAGEFVAEPRQIESDATFTTVSAGDGVTCGTTADRGVLCAGSGWALGQGWGWHVQSSTMVPLAPPGPLPAFIDR